MPGTRIPSAGSIRNRYAVSSINFIVELPHSPTATGVW